MLSMALMLGGCFFRAGKTLDREAFVRPKMASGHVVEFRETSWSTGSSHLPFDFTIYEQDAIYEFEVPALEGTFDMKDLEIRRCGQRLPGAKGEVRLSEQRMTVSPTASAVDKAVREPPAGSFQLASANGPSRRCESRKR